MQIERIDHVVLTVRDLEATCRFYERVLGMQPETFGEGRRALRFGTQKINLHEAGKEFEPKAATAMPGSADLCFRTATPISEVTAQFRSYGVLVELGPVPQTGARSQLQSVYIRDPDGNLIEIANEVSG